MKKDHISLSTGSASLTLDGADATLEAAGTITLSAPNIVIKGVLINVAALSTLLLHGGSTAKLSSDGTVTIAGANITEN